MCKKLKTTCNLNMIYIVKFNVLIFSTEICVDMNMNNKSIMT